MHFCGFQVTSFRNIRQSNWIPVDALHVILGEEGSGNTNLLKALHKFNPPQAEDSPNLSKDWPTGDLTSRSSEEIFCKVKFHLSKKEIEALTAAAYEQPFTEKSLGPINLSAISGLQLPDTLGVMVSRNYSGQYYFNYDTPLMEGINEERANSWIKQNLPKIVYVDSANLVEGHADLAEISKKIGRAGASIENLSANEKISLGILKFSGLSIETCLSQSQAGIFPSRSFALAQASSALSRHFTQLSGQRQVRFDIRIDEAMLDIFVEDASQGTPLHLREYSAWIRWFLSFISQFSEATAGNMTDCIILLDEPGLHFSPTRRQELLEYLQKTSATNTIIYTTQLGTMIDITRPERLIVLTRKEQQTTVNTKPFQEPAPALPFPLLQALGLAADTRALIKVHPTLLVADIFEVEILNLLSAAARTVSAPALSERIHIISAGGQENFLIYSSYLVSQKITSAALVKTDNEGDATKAKIKDFLFGGTAPTKKSNFTILEIGEIAEIEQNEASLADLFPTDFYLEIANEAFGTDVKATELPEEGSDSVEKRFAVTLRKRGREEALDKSRLISPLAKRISAIQTESDFPKGTLAKAQKLFSSLNTAFSLTPPAVEKGRKKK